MAEIVQPAQVTASPAKILYEQQHITDDRSAALIAANVVCVSLAFIAVCMRFTSRRMAKIKYKADDWLIISGLFFTACEMTCLLLAVRWGFGKHSIADTHPVEMRKIIVAADVIYNGAMGSIKASILVLYHRVFFVSRRFTKMLWAVGIFVFGYSGILGGASLIQCLPLNYIWDRSVKGFCLRIPIAATILAIFNFLTDIIILVMPMPILWKMQIETKEKYQIMGMFLTGGFVSFCSLYRTVIIHSENWVDPSWDDIPLGVWTMAELGIGVVSACLPTMRPLFVKAMSLFRSSSSESDQQEAEFSNPSDPSLNPPLQPQPSNPALSESFRHIGILGDLETGEDEKSGVKQQDWRLFSIPVFPLSE
ncbi:hypothetical protein JMJ35_007140 [Cladonia borealis]|uniref:Rhodopsin domain-containing protein n=1 Tax=Cladonia borealis TaxID=184061 RepID=A0AA39QWX5_9LECA|nr:hypothetical protein JMJ35_007140 [Cladonia borealis]